MKKNNSKYYTICTPQQKNVGTGNVCINEKDIFEFKKDFLFDQEVNGVRVTKVLPKAWVVSHIDTMFASRKSNNNLKNSVFSFHILKIKDILKY